MMVDGSCHASWPSADTSQGGGRGMAKGQFFTPLATWASGAMCEVRPRRLADVLNPAGRIIDMSVFELTLATVGSSCGQQRRGCVCFISHMMLQSETNVTPLNEPAGRLVTGCETIQKGHCQECSCSKTGSIHIQACGRLIIAEGTVRLTPTTGLR